MSLSLSLSLSPLPRSTHLLRPLPQLQMLRLGRDDAHEVFVQPPGDKGEGEGDEAEGEDEGCGVGEGHGWCGNWCGV